MAAEPALIGEAQIVDTIVRGVVELLEGSRARSDAARPSAEPEAPA